MMKAKAILLVYENRHAPACAKRYEFQNSCLISLPSEHVYCDFIQRDFSIKSLQRNGIAYTNRQAIITVTHALCHYHSSALQSTSKYNVNIQKNVC